MPCSASSTPPQPSNLLQWQSTNLPSFRVCPQILGHQTSIRLQRRCHTLWERNLYNYWILTTAWCLITSCFKDCFQKLYIDFTQPLQPFLFLKIRAITSTSKNCICNPVIWLQDTVLQPTLAVSLLNNCNCQASQKSCPQCPAKRRVWWVW